MKKIAIIGVGNIGSGLTNLLQNHPSFRKDFELSYTCSRSTKPQDLHSSVTHTNNYQDIISDPSVDIVVETIGGVQIALEVVRSALESGKNVVTANKMLVAENAKELAALAKSNKVSLLFEAAVCGGIPIVRNLKDLTRTSKIHSIYGIMNGTSNYMLSKMTSEGCSFDIALKSAQDLGYAEPDPSLDLNGFDIAHKAYILSSIAFGEFPAFITAEKNVFGIEKITQNTVSIAGKSGYKVKLISHITPNGLTVTPTLVSPENSLFHIELNFNSVLVDTGTTGAITYTGQGAGSHPTSLSILLDIWDIINNTQSSDFGIENGIQGSKAANSIKFNTYAKISNESINVHNSALNMSELDGESIFPVLN